MAVPVLFAHWNHATMSYFADNIFELNGGVIDVKFGVQPFLYFTQNSIARGRRKIFDRNVTRYRARFGSDVPHMQIAAARPALDRTHGGLDTIQADAARRALEKN